MFGRTVGQYQFLEKLGEGGMGEIYKAQDAKLNRFVAIKVLPDSKSGDPDRHRRFIQEAQAASALNHPNIITIHDIVSDGDTEFMVMEYVAGKTLVDLIPRGGLRVPQVLKYGVQMADALSAAHAAGIIHRDLKPGNVMVTESGLVKILDFGLAKLTAPPTSQIDDTKTIMDAPQTVEGSIIGTVSYMSPEQAQGKKVDVRSDIFSFGLVLYEMVTGCRAFKGESSISTLTAILRDETQPIPEITPDVPPQLDELIGRCLRKNPDERWQSMKDVQMAMMALKREADSGMLYQPRVRPGKGGSSRILLYAAAGLVAVIVALAGVGGWWWMTHRNRPQPQTPAATTAAPAQAPAQAPPEAFSAPPAGTPPAPAENLLTNDNIIEMVKAKVPASLIIDQIRSSKTDFNLSAGEVIRLTKAGVPANIIEVMRNPQRGVTSVARARTPVPHQALPTSKTSSPITPAPTQQPPVPKVAEQAPAQPQKPAGPAVPSFVAVAVSDGLPFQITLAEDIPAGAKPGRPLRFTVADGLRIGNAMVIAKGALVTGSITEAARKRFLGGTKMMFRLLQVEAVDGHKLHVRAMPAKSTDGFSPRPVETGKSKSKDIAAAAGAEYIGYVDGDQAVSVRK